MPPKSKEPAKEPVVEPDAPVQPIPLTIGGPDEPDPDDPPKVDPETQAALDQVEALKKQLKDAASRETQSQSRLDQILAAPAVQPVTPVAVAPVAVEDLPDPTLNPKDFAAAVNARITQGITAATGPIKTAASQQQKIAELRSTFQARHADLSEFSDLVDGEVMKRAKEAAAAGRDPEAMMFTNIPGFVDEVAAAVKTRLEAIRGPGEKKPAEQKPNREAGLFGGNDPVKDPAAKTAKKEPSFIDQIKKAQRESGMF